MEHARGGQSAPVEVFFKLSDRQVDHNRAAVGTEPVDVGLLEAGKQDADLARRKGVPRPNGAVAGESGGEAIHAIGTNRITGEGVGSILERFGQIRPDQARRNRAHHERIGTKFLQGEAKLREGTAALREGGPLPSGQLDDERRE